MVLVTSAIYNGTREIDTSGATDVTDDLLSFFAEVPDGYTIDLGGGSFRCDKPLELSNRKGLTIHNGTVYATEKGPAPNGFYNDNGIWVSLSDPRSKRRHWAFYGCSDLNLDQLSVRSTNTVASTLPGYGQYEVTYEAEHGFEFICCDRVSLTNFDTIGTWGDGVYVGGDHQAGRGCTDVRIGTGEISWNGRQAIAATWVNGLIIEDTQILNSRRSGIDLEPNAITNEVRNVIIRRGTSNSTLQAFPSKGQGAVSDVLIEDYTVFKSSYPLLTRKPPAGIESERWTIRRLKSEANVGSPRYALELFGTTDVEISDSNIYMRLGGSGTGNCILLSDCGGHLKVTDNIFQPGGKYITVTNPRPGATQEIARNAPFS